MDEHALLTRLESDQSTMDPRAPSSPSEPSTPPAPSPDAACDGLLNSPDSSNPAPSGSQSSLEPSQDPSALAVDEERHPKGKRKRTAWVPQPQQPTLPLQLGSNTDVFPLQSKRQGGPRDGIQRKPKTRQGGAS